MKKLFRNAWMLSAIAGTLFFTACDDEDEVSSNPSVSIEVADEQDTYSVGETVNFEVNFTSTANVVGASVDVSTEENDFDLTISNGGIVSNVVDLNFFNVAGVQEGNFTISGFVIPEEAAGSTLTFEITMQDSEGRTGTANAELVVEERGIEFYEQVLFGAQGNAEEGFYNAISNIRYGYAEAREASGSSGSPVDFAYYWGSNNKNSIAAIDDAGLHSVYNSVDLPISGVFGTRNSTRFRVTELSPADFNAIENNSDLVASAASELNTNTAATQLAVGSVVAFKLDEDRGDYVGLIHVTAINDTNGEGTITIEVKVQSTVE
ncbi:hypothetical protein GCM10011506_29590 [Marivirga lumbricoides]|uniref:DUF4625 domain-containing protein n=1 Tax=Marivirga lumbricoides TaxID=1046115 RepID=A0ABQ1MKF0_9BACT|nr:hypothetical protein GCM10011506_29590 [Marivirga lumbricoides]